ncbi:8c4ba44a-f874-459f-8201-1e81ee1ad4c4-CDS [Sclerotinia trifoliorum]|uniref:8c4ba44a-f874-459f-8201-1e81ee1ad4c4-CDS n=1 Tax=Sclerotinia trifoliorum TaxID=28548 RepID=A0A8H2W052_9HELO|nr:8c4ba44a-f874-459f-8201-1e81ee1ad4c4-CDS [Sclerotinia trifoliorum]
MGYKILSEKLGGGLPQYSRLPQQEQDDAKLPVSRKISHPSNIFQYIRLIIYSLAGIAFITSFLWAGPAALRSYLNAPSSSSVSSTITNTSSPTISLIIASSKQDRDPNPWTKELEKDNLAIIEYNPPTFSSEGSGALIYLMYIYEAYDNLSPISIFIDKWEPAEYAFPLSQTDLINRLDFATVQSRGYLPFCFQDVSSSGINASVISLFHQHFPKDEIPDKFTGPCGRFAVSRDAIHSVPREQYLHHANLLNQTRATSDMGNEWNVMWKYLFLHGDTIEIAPSESLCQAWEMCLDEGEWKNLNRLWNEMETAREKLDLMKQLGKTFDLSEEIQALEHDLKELKSVVENANGLNVGG